MIDIKEDSSQEFSRNDLIALANVKRTGNVDAKIKFVINSNSVKIDSVFTGMIGDYAIIADEICKVSGFINGEKESEIVLDRALKGTDITTLDLIGCHFRTVILLEGDLNLLKWDFDDSIGSLKNTLFPCDVTSGKIDIVNPISNWIVQSPTYKYMVRNKKTVAYIFRGTQGSRYLKYTTLVNNVSYNTRGKSEGNKITLQIKNMLSRVYEKDMAVNQQIKGMEIKEMLKLILGLEDNEVYYANGITKDSFITIGNIHTKEYKKMSELLKALCSHGVRFCYDRLERVKIFSDFKVSSIQSEKTLKYSIIESMINSDSKLIYNTMSVESYERQTLFNFEELDNRYVYFGAKLENAINNNALISVNESGDFFTTTVTIKNDDLSSKVQLGDYVLFKMKESPYLEFYARVLVKDSNGVSMNPFIEDKDRNTLSYGKYNYLFKLFEKNPSMCDLYYVRYDLPQVFRYSTSYSNTGDLSSSTDKNTTSNLMYPILPKVDGEVKFKIEKYLTFGCASNLKSGEFANYSEEIEDIYGDWDSSKLLYNMEHTQFNGKGIYPPISVLSNHVSTNAKSKLIEYTTFDNRDLQISITKSKNKNKECDAVLNMYNNFSINSSIDLYRDSEVSRVGNKVIEVKSVSQYSLGDILVCERLEKESEQDKRQYDEVIKHIRWRVVAITIENQSDGSLKYYLFLDSNFAKPLDKSLKYEFIRYPATSIIYLQELYIRGNPVIQYQQEIVGTSNAINPEGDLSIDIFDEQEYKLEAKLTNTDGVKMLMGYILNNFNATTEATTKYSLPLKVSNELGLELLDVISVVDTVYTNVNARTKWLVTSEKASSDNHTTELTLLNLNETDTKPWDVDIKDVIEYNPIEIPNYSGSGGDGDTVKPDDGQSGSGEDPTLGEFALGRIEPKDFSAKVDRFSGGYIYFKDFKGEKAELYEGALFPESEFAIEIDGEIIFVHSDMKDRAYIRKRQVRETPLTMIVPNQVITFYVCTSYVDPDGTLRARRCHFGDGDTYFDFHPITGAKFVGDFIVGDSNKHAGNDLWESLQKNRTFRQPTEPFSNPTYTLRVGDIWYDTDDNNHLFVFNGTTWDSTRDKLFDTALSNSKIFYQAEPPVSSSGYTLKENDLWFDTDEGNSPFIYQNQTWVSARDNSIITEAGNRVYYSATEPTSTALISLKDGDIWIDSDEGNIQYVYQNNKWNDIRDKGIIDALKGARVFFDKVKPVSVVGGYQLKNGDIWYDTLNGNKTSVYSNGSWVLAQDLDIEKALLNSKIFRQDKEPINTDNYTIKDGDLWYKTNDNNHMYVYGGAKWNDAKDKSYVNGGGNRTYYQSASPVDKGDITINEGDLWFDIDDNNHPYTRKNNSWISSRDGSIMSANNSIFFQNSAPTSTESRPLRDGDLWYDTMNGNRPYVYTNNVWTNAQDQSIITALENSKIFYQDEKPTSSDFYTIKPNDLWYDTNDGNAPYVYKNNDWISVRDKSILTEGGNRIYYSAIEPVGTVEIPLRNGDMWIDSDEGNIQYVYSDKKWNDSRDKGIIEGLSNSKVFFQSEKPKDKDGGYKLKDGDIWYDTDDGNKTYVYSINKMAECISSRDEDLESTDIENTYLFIGNSGEWISAQDNAIIEALKSSLVYYQSSEPTIQRYPSLKDGDIWYDIDDNNHMYVYGSAKWNDAKDKSYLTEGGNRIYYQNTQPIATDEKPLVDKDLWFDTDDKNHPYIYTATKWVSSRDGSILSANNSIFFQPEAPISSNERPLREGDLWYDTNDGNKPHVYNTGIWTSATDKNLEGLAMEAQKQADLANTEISNISDDDKLSPSEKQSTKKDLDIINVEYPKIISEALKFSVDTTKYKSQHVELNKYLSPLLSDLTDTSTILGGTFRDNFKNYYAERQDVLNAITTKVKDLADKAQNDANNALDTNSKVFYQDEEPKSTSSYKLKDGDIWYDTNDGNAPYVYKSTVWKSARDNAIIIQGGNRVYFQSNAPTGSQSIPLKDGDIWIDTDEGNLQHVWTSNQWNDCRDKGITEALGNARVFFQDNEPRSQLNGYTLKTGDIWYDTNDENLTRVYNSTTSRWEIAQDGKILTANNKIFFQIDQPKSTEEYTLRENDVWYDTDDGNKVYVYKLNQWKDAQDKAITTALGNAKIFYQTTPPTTGMKENDLWYDTDDGNHPYVFIGGDWKSARDKIFETEGGNKVYFQDSEPLTTTVGVKEGDMWFKTSENNKMFILMKQVDASLVWTLADDSLDKINNGRIVLNGNTTINGDFKVVGQNVELTGATKVNGILEVFSGNQGIISYNGVDEQASTRKIVIKGGEIEFWERI